MSKNDSLNFLQSCIDRIANASEEDIEMFRMKYDMHCMEPMISSEFEFISPGDISQDQKGEVFVTYYGEGDSVCVWKGMELGNIKWCFSNTI